MSRLKWICSSLAIGIIAIAFLGACTPEILDIIPATFALPSTAAEEENKPFETPQPPAEILSPAPTNQIEIKPLQTTSPPAMTGALQKKLVALASKDLAAHLNIDIDQIHLISIEPAIWPDAALGCPQPNTMYTQVLTEGYRIILQAQSEQYHYHTDMAGAFLLCDLNSPPSVKRTPEWR